MKTRYKVLIGLVLTFAVAYVVLIRPTSAPASCAFRLDVAKARALTAATAGDKPATIHSEYIASFMFPETAVYAGASWSKVALPVRAYQLVYPDRSIMLDSALNAAFTKESQGEDFDDAAWERLTVALERASAVYVTHEHGDHMAGLFTPGKSLYKNAHLTPEQLAATDRLKPATIPDEARAVLKPLEYDVMTALAPGLVAIKAPGHTPGSQWFFVTRADGAELLFVGDTAWQMSNIVNEQGPPRLVSLLLHNDRDANACQLIALHDLQATIPEVVIVPGHDGPRAALLEKQGLIVPHVAL